MTNEEKGWKIIKDMHISGAWQEHIAHKAVMTAMEWKEHQIIVILQEMEIEDHDIVDYANEYQSPSYGFSVKFLKRLKQAIKEYENDSNI